MQTAFFTGHRVLPEREEYDRLKGRIDDAIGRLVACGVDTFINGGAGGFDCLAAACVIEARKAHPHIKLKIYLPYPNHGTRPQFILRNADEVRCISGHYYDGCMHKRNRAMADESQYCVAYLNKGRGGTFYTVNYAVEKNIHIENLATRLKEV